MKVGVGREEVVGYCGIPLVAEERGTRLIICEFGQPVWSGDTKV